MKFQDIFINKYFSMKQILRFSCLMMAVLFAQSPLIQLSAQDIPLKFNNNKQFKIAQFTDTHFYIGGEKSPEVIENIKAVLDTEKPDLVILTGDIVTGDGKTHSSIKNWELITDLFIQEKIPYAVAFGNHDDEAEISRQDLLEYLSKRPHCLISDTEGEVIEGVGNYVLPVYNQEGKPEKLIYCMDSRSYSIAGDRGIKGYGWFDRSQVNWFAETNGEWLTNHPDIQTLAFFHIPLPEYRYAFDHGEFKKGVRKEKECSPDINTGMFAEMALQGNVLGTFVGHDHNNNYVAQLYKIALCYGYFSGGNSYGKLPLNGARIILLEEGSRSFTTWHRLRDGKVLDRVELPHQKK